MRTTTLKLPQGPTANNRAGAYIPKILLILQTRIPVAMVPDVLW